MSDDPPSTSVRLEVNAEVCIGSGHCEMLEANVFYIDDDTAIAAVVGDGLLPRDRAEAVIDSCPSGAISVSTTEPGAS